MSYFKFFPQVRSYKFGNEQDFTAFQNISVYVDIIDQVKENSSFYLKYNIIDGERPDQVSLKLYGNVKYHWTFFLMNDSLREQGWPLASQKLNELISTKYPNTTITTTESISNRFLPGQVVSGLQSGATGTIQNRRLDFGQIILTNAVGNFIPGEIVTSTSGDQFQSMTISSASLEYLAIDHWEDQEGNWVDVDPAIGTSGIYTPYTIQDKYTLANDQLKEIRVLKPAAINTVYSTFIESLGT